MSENESYSNRSIDTQYLFAYLFIFTNRIETAFNHEMYDVTLKQFMLLIVLERHRRPMTLTEIGQVLGSSRQNIKKIVDKLKVKGLVSIQKSHIDKRAYEIKATKKLESFFKVHDERFKEKMTGLFSGYRDEELIVFRELLMKLNRGIDRIED